MSSIPLTLAEAVPLGTVLLQRLLDDAGIRSLVIKGPAFVELGVRRPKHSNDIDLLIAPGDRATATEVLTGAGWSIISHWFPPALDDIIYSTTFRHPQFPSTLDLHHHFSGLLREGVFDRLWTARTEAWVGHQLVSTVSREHALIIEVLNCTKYLVPRERPAAATRVVESAVRLDVAEIEREAEMLGARHTASPLIEAMGGEPAVGPPPDGYRRWVEQPFENRGRQLAKDLLLRAPQHVPRVVWQQLALDPHMAQLWARAHGVTYVSPLQVLMLRLRIIARGRVTRR